MKGMLLGSPVAVLAVIFALERSSDLARTRRLSGNDSWSLYDRSAKASIQQECGPDPRIPVHGDVRNVAKDLEVGHRASPGTAAQK